MAKEASAFLEESRSSKAKKGRRRQRKSGGNQHTRAPPPEVDGGGADDAAGGDVAASAGGTEDNDSDVGDDDDDDDDDDADDSTLGANGESKESSGNVIGAGASGRRSKEEIAAAEAAVEAWRVIENRKGLRVTGRQEYFERLSVSELVKTLIDTQEGVPPSFSSSSSSGASGAEGKEGAESGDGGSGPEGPSGLGGSGGTGGGTSGAGLGEGEDNEISSGSPNDNPERKGNSDGTLSSDTGGAVSAGTSSGSSSSSSASSDDKEERGDDGKNEGNDGGDKGKNVDGTDRDGGDDSSGSGSSMMIMTDSKGRPVAPGGMPCVEDLSLPTDKVCSMVSNLRRALIDVAETTAAAREREIGSLFQERKNDYTFELEERLRTHWPRKGRTDVGAQQPRIGELIAHRQRHERQVRSIKIKLRAQDEHFASLLEQARATITKYVSRLLSLIGNIRAI